MYYKLYESYGALAHERRPIYSDTIPATEHYNIITVDMPFALAENAMGETLIDIDGETYLLAQVLTCRGDEPCIRWYDNRQKEHHRVLERVRV